MSIIPPGTWQEINLVEALARLGLDTEDLGPLEYKWNIEGSAIVSDDRTATYTLAMPKTLHVPGLHRMGHIDARERKMAPRQRVPPEYWTSIDIQAIRGFRHPICRTP